MELDKTYLIEEPIQFYNKWGELVYVSEAIQRIINLNQQCIESSRDCVSLLWPGSIQQPALTHVLACLQDCSEGNQQGQRTVLFPAKANSLTLLNNFHIDSQFLKSVAFKKEQYKRFDISKDPLIMPLASKMSLFASTPKYKEHMGVPKPMFSELTATFPINTVDVVRLRHLNYSEKYFVRSRRANPRHCVKQTLLDMGRTLGCAQTSPDTLFALHQTLDEQEIRTTLHFLKECKRKVDVIHIVLDRAHNQSSQVYRQTRKNLTCFFDCLTDVFGPERPPVLAICSEINWFNICNLMITDLAKDIGRPSPMLKGIECPDVELPLVLSQNVTSGQVPAIEFVAHLTDNESSTIVRDWCRFKKLLNEAGQNTDSVHWAIQFIRNLASLPCAIEDYWDWYYEKYGADTLAQTTWPHFESKIKQAALSLNQIGMLELERLCANTSNWIRKVKRGTPLAFEISRILSSDELNGWPIAVVCPNEPTRRLLETFLEYESVDCSQIDLLKQSEFLTKNFELNKYLAILPIQMKPEIKRHIFQKADGIQVHLPMTEFDAFNLKNELQTLLLLSDFKRYHPVLRPLKEQLDSRLSVFEAMPELYSVYSRQPKSIRAYAKQSNTVGQDTQHAVRIQFDNGDVEYLGRHSSIYLRDSSSTSELMSSFRRVNAEDLTVGQEVFRFSESSRQKVQYLLSDFIEIEETAKNIEQLIRTYHKRTLMLLEQRFGSKYERMYAARRILDVMKGIWRTEYKGADFDIKPSNICYWIDLKKSTQCNYSELSTWAPKQKEVFFCFMQALGCDLTEAVLYWDAIMKFRTNRIQDGRTSNAQYLKTLFDSSALRAYEGVSREAVEELEQIVEKNLLTVAEIEFSMMDELTNE